MAHTSLAIAPFEDLDDECAPTPANDQASPPQRILLVEDDADIRQLTSDVLRKSGYQVDTAEDGEAGWKMLHAVRYDPDSYDLLITDNNMPRLSGCELIKRVRAERMILPVILATGSEPINTECLQLAALLPKPFTSDQLVQTVKQALHWSSVIVNKGDYRHT